ncbi:MAG: LamG domain-containing protein [Candidatus Omnitrophota bacterium]
MKKLSLIVIFLTMTLPAFAQIENREGILDVQRKAGTALEFDGIDDVVTVGPFTALYANTIEGWIKSTGKEKGTIFANGGGPTATCTQGIILRISDAELCYDLNPAKCGTDGEVCYTADLTGQWTHFAGTYDGNTANLFINGQRVKTMSGMSFDSGDWSTLGGLQFYNGFQSFFQGELDELRVWNVSRTEEEIRSTMYKRLLGNETGLVAYWTFDEGQGQTVHESIYGQFDGVLGTTDQIESTDPRWIPSDAPLSCRTDDCLDPKPHGPPGEFLKRSFIQFEITDDSIILI